MIHVGDGTWNLRIIITDLQCEKTLRVKGDLHIGGVMLKLVDPGWWYFLLLLLLKYKKLILIIKKKTIYSANLIKPLECIGLSLCLVFSYILIFFLYNFYVHTSTQYIGKRTVKLKIYNI